MDFTASPHVRLEPLVLASMRSVIVRLELPEGLNLPEEPRFTVINPRARDEILVTRARQDEDHVWDLFGLPDGSFTIDVDATSAFKPAKTAVTVGQGADVEAKVRLERRAD